MTKFASKMPLTSVSMVRNEADIIEAFVRHHVRWLDRMLIVVHRPDVPDLKFDNTEQILRDLAAEGLPLDIEIFEEERQAHGELVTKMVRKISQEQERGWVFPLDADEFVVPNSGHELVETLAAFDGSKALLIPWRTYVPSEFDVTDEPNAARRIQQRRQREPEIINKVILPAPLAAQSKSRISKGSHRFKIGKTALNEKCDTITLAHIPIRSVRQIRTKIFGGWLTDLSERTKKDGPNRHWQVLYQHLAHSNEISASQLQELALDYISSTHEDEDRSLILDAIPTIDFDLTYEPQPIDPWELLANYAEKMAAQLGEKKRSSGFSWRV